jgi:nucleotide-binding universal stress UspA family protein
VAVAAPDHNSDGDEARRKAREYSPLMASTRYLPAVAMEEAAGECSRKDGCSVTAAPFRRVLVGWDGSANAAEALSIAASVVNSDGGHVVALAVVPPALDSVQRAETRRRVEDGFNRARQEGPATRDAWVSLAVVEDRNAGPAVCAYAKDHGFDLLVLGRHGEGGLRTRLGRVAEAATRDRGIPVLLVSPPGGG